ncbi:hypothetical protein FRC03_000330 [Tulasnella sp. 419]|nr:hypothetical protein FRC03_000330 [Tulasnella sp. 419]
MDYLVSLASRPVRYLASAVDDIKKEKDRYELSTPQYAMSREGVGSQSPNLHDPLLTKQYTRPKKWIPLNLRPFFTGGLIALMIVLAVATQALLAVSERRQGWRTNGIERYGGTNFLKSVVPVLLVMPITYLWTKIDESVRKMHAYVVLARGNAPVEKSILLNYTGG